MRCVFLFCSFWRGLVRVVDFRVIRGVVRFVGIMIGVVV